VREHFCTNGGAIVINVLRRAGPARIIGVLLVAGAALVPRPARAETGSRGFAAVAAPAGYFASEPTRVLDTRFGLGASRARLEPGVVLSLDLSAPTDTFDGDSAVSNLISAPLAADGSICIAGPVLTGDVIVDIAGFFTHVT
jgi:hypothetical protein